MENDRPLTATLTPAAREALRRDLLTEQAGKAKAIILNDILDMTYQAQGHLQNAANISAGREQASYERAIARLEVARLELYGAIGATDLAPDRA